MNGLVVALILIVGVAVVVCTFSIGWPGFAPVAIILTVIAIQTARPRP